MTPILYNGTETAFSTNGLGRIPCTSCIVREERNGIFECTFTVPVSEDIYPKITEGKIIYCIHDDAHDAQPFDIYAKSAPMNGLVTFRAHHISYRLSKMVCKPFNATTCADAISKISSNIIGTNPFTFWTNKSVTATMNNEIPSTVRSLLAGSAGSLLDVYGKGEYQFDKFNVNLYLNRGVDKGVTIRYGKNLTDITQETDISQTYNAVAPYWVSAETGTIITLDAGMVVKTDQVVDNQIKCVPLDLSGDFDTAPTQQQLSDRASAWLDSSDAWVMKENLTVDFVALWQSPEYENYAALERVSLCDKVSVIHPILGIAANKIEVIAVEYDVLRERYTRMELGQPKATYADVLKAETVQSVLSQVPSTDVMEQAIAYASEMITGAMGGCVVVNRDANGKPFELLILDTDNINTAVNVWRWNTGGLGHSHNGYGGPYSDVALTADGRINANMITTGILTAIKIVNGNNTFVVETDGTVTAKAISITNGTINCGSGNFTVSSSGDVVAKSISITNGSINCGNGKFTVSSTGSVVAKAISITDGSINCGSGNFTVSSAGNVVAKSISITDGSINCGSGNFTVSSAGAVTAKAINIQGGSINISTNTDSYDVIELSYNQGGNVKTAKMAPLSFVLHSEWVDPNDQSQHLDEGLFYANGLRFSTDNNESTNYTSKGAFYYTTSNTLLAYYGLQAIFYDSSGHDIARYASSIYFKDTNGNIVLSQSGSSLTYYDITNSTKATLSANNLAFYDSNNVIRTYASKNGIILTDTNGSTSAMMMESGLTYINNNVRSEVSANLIRFKDNSISRLEITATNEKRFDASGVIGMMLEPRAMSLYDSSGKKRSYSNITHFAIYDSAEKTRYIAEAQKISMYASDGFSTLLELGVANGLLLYDSTGTTLRSEITVNGVKVRDASGNITAEVSGNNGINICNVSGSLGLMIDGVGYSQTSGAWGFKEVTTSDNRKVRIPSFIVTSETSRLAANSDLNNLLNNGNYVVHNADAPSISNTPYTAGGFMIRVDFFGPVAVVQSLYPGAKPEEFYVRRKYGSSSPFSGWYKYTGTAV